MAETGGSGQNTLEILLGVDTERARKEVDKFLADTKRKVESAEFRTPATSARGQEKLLEKAQALLTEANRPTARGARNAEIEGTLAPLRQILSGDFGKPKPGSIAETQANIAASQARLQNTVGNPFIILSTISQTITGFAGLKRELFEASAALNQLEAASKTARKGSAKRQQIDDQIAVQQARAAKAQKGLSGVTGAVRAVADFGLNSLITGAFLSVGFQATSAVIQAVIDDFSRGLGYLIDPTQRAREAFDKLASSIETVGGATGLGKLVGLTESQVALIEAASRAKDIQPVIDAMLSLGEAQGIALRTGLGPEGVQDEQSRKAYVDSIIKGAGLDTFVKFSRYGSETKDVAMARQGVTGMGPEALAAFDKRLAARIAESSRISGTAATPTLNDLEAALRSAAEAAYDASVNLDSIASAKATQAFENVFTGLQSTLFSGGAVGPTGAVQTAQSALSSAQSRLSAEQDRVNRANSARQRQMQIDEARRGVGQAGVAGTGDTVFDVAQRIIDAQANLDKTQRSEQIQGNIAKYTKQVADATQALADEKNLAAFADAAPALVEALKAMTPEARAAEMKRLMSFEFVGNDKTTKALAELLKGLFDTVYGAGGRRGPNNV